jgi:hypothetical protein
MDRQLETLLHKVPEPLLCLCGHGLPLLVCHFCEIGGSALRRIRSFGSRVDIEAVGIDPAGAA